jgi:flavin-dependent dehydrogenase
MEKYDLVVIGGGPAGYAGAMRALDFKKKVLLVEKRRCPGSYQFVKRWSGISFPRCLERVGRQKLKNNAFPTRPSLKCSQSAGLFYSFFVFKTLIIMG